MPFKAACAGIAPDKADVGVNLDKIAEASLQAVRESVDLLLFPETVVSGYFLEGGVLESSLTADELCAALGQRLGKLPRPLDIALGFYERKDGNLYNSAAYLEFGPDGPRVVRTYHKFFLPTYGVFDEERFVARGRDLCVFESRFGRIALLICEDVWHSMLPSLCAVAGAQILLVPAASPGRGLHGETIDNLDRYQRLFRSISEEHGIFCLNAQLCGFEGGKGLSGGSMIVDPFGTMLASGPLLDEHLIIADIDVDMVGIARAASPLVADLQTLWSDIQRLVSELP